MNVILQTEFDSLINPELLTQELAILLVGLLIAMLWASIRLRSMFSLFGWMIMIVVLMVSIFTNLQMLWFWIAVIAESFLLTLSMIAYFRQAKRQIR